eukprot:COSAG06_NODE_1307_length_9916_cov_99.462361_14_plen_72_part_00
MVGHTDWILSCRAFVENGVTKALSSSRDHTLRLWNPDKGECLRVFQGKKTPVLRHFSYRHDRFAKTGSGQT